MGDNRKPLTPAEVVAMADKLEVGPGAGCADGQGWEEIAAEAAALLRVLARAQCGGGTIRDTVIRLIREYSRTFGCSEEDTADAIIAALSASPAAPSQEGWQPIETAPKDGTEILIFDRLVRIGFWDTARGSIWSQWPGRAAAWPTHWRPLPLPPAPLSTEGGER